MVRITGAAAACVTLMVFGACRSAEGGGGKEPIAWRPWAPAAFADAKATDRLVLLDLGAEWCHWCHVMQRETYGDAGVRAVLAARFVAIEADADQRLDLAARYQEWGWPATVVFDADGKELWKNRGYVPALRMRETLQRLADTRAPIAAPESRSEAVPAEETFAVLRERLDALYDDERGGFGFVHKYVDDASIEWLLDEARRGDDVARRRVLQTLDAERALLDPVWGGAWQYSHGGVWTNPHFEKVMSRQRADLRAYSLAFGAFGREEDLIAARGVARFVTSTLRSPEGAFWASQDADVVRGEHAADYFAKDDAGRRALGVPRIERSPWSRENGQAIQGLCALLAVDRDAALLESTVTAAEWIVTHRLRADGTFAHGERDAAGPFLSDSLEMATAAIALGEVTGERRWLDLAVATVIAIDERFAAHDGYATAVGDGVLAPVVDRAENVQLARVANRLAAVTADVVCRRVADRAFAFASASAIALQPGLPANLLLAAAERENEPMHVVVVGENGDPAAEELFAIALRRAPSHRFVERVTPGGSSANGTEFPVADGAAAFVCADGSCSPPIADPAALVNALANAPAAGRRGPSRGRTRNCLFASTARSRRSIPRRSAATSGHSCGSPATCGSAAATAPGSPRTSRSS